MKGRKLSLYWHGLQVEAIIGPPGLVGDPSVPDGSYVEAGEIMSLSVETSDGWDLTEWLNDEALDHIYECIDAEDRRTYG